jgi:arsenate reductase
MMSFPSAGASRPSAFVTRPPMRVLFLCVHNSSRSQIAEAFARALAPAGVQVMSAGTEPTGVHPRAAEVMKEVGIDISVQRSKHLNEVPWAECDTVVTLCGEAEESCPTLAGDVRRVHWPLPDPSAVHGAGQLTAFLDVRDEIRWRVASLWPRCG